MLPGRLRKHISRKNVSKAIHLPALLPGTQERFQKKQLRPYAKTENELLILVYSEYNVAIGAQMIANLAVRGQHI